MKKLINLLMALMLLLTCVLTACMGNETDMPSDEPATSNQSSKAEENSDPDVSNVVVANPEDITGTLWEGETKVYNDNRVIVYDNQANYDFFKNRRVRVYIPFVVKSVENGIATVEFLNAAKTKQDIKYSDVVYGEENIISGFTIKDESLGDIKVEDGFWLEGETYIELYKKDETAPLVNESDWVASGYIRFDCEYDYYADYKCDIIYPNGKTVQKTVVIDETENVISTVTLARHYFEGTKPSFTGGKVSPNGTAYDIYEFYGIGDKYGTGYATFGISVKSFGNGVAEIWHNEEWINVNYNEPVFDYVSPDEKYSTGTIDISGTICEITHKKAEYDGEYLSTYENYIIYYNPNNSLEALSTITLTLSEDGGVQRLEIDTYFEWTSDGDTVTITYPNGVTETETLYRNNYGDYLLYEPQ